MGTWAPWAPVSMKRRITRGFVRCDADERRDVVQLRRSDGVLAVARFERSVLAVEHDEVPSLEGDVFDQGRVAVA